MKSRLPTEWTTGERRRRLSVFRNMSLCFLILTRPYLSLLITFAGFPATSTSPGKESFTTEPAATIDLSPILQIRSPDTPDKPLLKNHNPLSYKLRSRHPGYYKSILRKACHLSVGYFSPEVPICQTMMPTSFPFRYPLTSTPVEMISSARGWDLSKSATLNT